MIRKKGLGKGLSALIPLSTEAEAPREKKAESEVRSTKTTAGKAPMSKAGTTSKTEMLSKTGTAPKAVPTDEFGTASKTASSKSAKSEAKGPSATSVKTVKKETVRAGAAADAAAAGEAATKPQSRKKAANSGTSGMRTSDGNTSSERFSGMVQLLSMEELETNPDQPRKYFAEDALDDLAASIQKYGILQPIVVKKHTAPGRAPYEIIAGERRFRAAQKAGLKEIPAVLREGERRETTMLSVIENVQREDLNPLEEATAYQQIMRDQMLTQQQLAEALGKSRAYIANIVRLLKLDDESLDALYRGLLTSSQARALLSEPDLKKRARYRQLLVEGRTNVNAVEKKTAPAAKKDVFLQEMETRLSEHLGSRVSIRPKRRGWHFQVECYTQEDLNRLLALLMEGDHE
ncbi:MAG: ParB/RepB/Spo0J family partition protein [Ndongobacter sp.]|nr:ParB/RepB/Spo0J family partition protein [Ndongobacter sp.]